MARKVAPSPTATGNLEGCVPPKATPPDGRSSPRHTTGTSVTSGASRVGDRYFEELLEELRAGLRDMAERHMVEQEQLFARLLREATTMKSHAQSTPNGTTTGLSSWLYSAAGAATGAEHLDQVLPGVHVKRGSTEQAFEMARRASQMDLCASVPLDTDALGRPLRKRRNSWLSNEFKRVPVVGHPLGNFIRWWSNLEEPPRSGRLARLVTSQLFGLVGMVVILANVGVIVATTNQAARTHDGSSDPILSQMDSVFLAFYCVELSLKLLVHRLFFFANKDMGWNIMDFTLVLFGLAEFLMSPTYLRSCRLFRVTRMGRIFRAVRAIDELRILLDSLLGSFITMFWSLLMLCFLLGVFAIYFVQIGTGDSQDGTAFVSEEDWAAYSDKFGSVGTAMITLIGATTGSDWTQIYRILAKTSILNGIIFLFFFAFFTLAVYNIVTSVFIEKAMKLAAPTLAECLEARRMEDQDYAQELATHIVDELGSDLPNDPVSGLERALRGNGQLKDFLALHGLDIKDPSTFFSMIAFSNGDAGDVDVASFVSACTRLRGSASSLDLSMVSFEVKLLAARQRQFQEFCEELLEDIHRAVSRLPTAVHAASKWARAVAAVTSESTAATAQGGAPAELAGASDERVTPPAGAGETELVGGGCDEGTSQAPLDAPRAPFTEEHEGGEGGPEVDMRCGQAAGRPQAPAAALLY